MKEAITQFIEENILPAHYKAHKLDLLLVAEELGIEVTNMMLPTDVLKGAIGLNDKGEWGIAMYSELEPTVARFALAHIIGYYISYQAGSIAKELIGKEGTIAFLRIADEDTNTNAVAEANTIAAHILMPKQIIMELIIGGSYPDDIARILGLSEIAVHYRIKKLGYEIYYKGFSNSNLVSSSS